MEHLYWIVMLDNIKNMFLIFSIFLLVGGGVLLIPCALFLCEDERVFKKEKDLSKKMIKPIIVSIMIGIFFIVVNTFTPSTKQIIAIITIPKIVNNEQMQDLPDNALKLINQKLKEWAQDTEIIPKEQPK